MTPEPTVPAIPEQHPHVIPAWMVPLLSLPIRRFWDKPERIVLPLIRPGDWVLEVGPGSGFFTLPMAKAVGSQGRILCVELQEVVRRRLERSVTRRGLAQVQVRPCLGNDLQIQDLEGSMDLAVAIDVLHETPDPASTMRQMAAALRPGGKLLVREPRGHCPWPTFQAEVAWAFSSGLVRQAGPWASGSKAQIALFVKPGPEQAKESLGKGLGDTATSSPLAPPFRRSPELAFMRSNPLCGTGRGSTPRGQGYLLFRLSIIPPLSAYPFPQFFRKSRSCRAGYRRH